MSKLNWKSIVGWGIAALVVAGIIGTNMYQQQQDRADGKRTVYAVLPLSGQFASYGKDVQKTMDMYVAENKPSFKIKYIDSEANPTKAVTALQQATLNDDEPIVISAFAFISSALAPVVEQKKGFLFAISTVTISTNSHSYQRMSRSAEDIMKVIAPYLSDNYKKVSIVYTQDDYGLKEFNFLKNEFAKTGVEVLSDIPLIMTQTDVRNEVVKLKSVPSDAVIVLGMTTQGYINMIRELKLQEYQGQVIADSGLTNPPVIKGVGPLSEGVILSAMTAEVDMEQPPKVQELKEKIAKNDIPMYFIVLEAVDTLDLIQYILDNKLPFSQETFTKLKEWDGVGGKMTFTGNGNASAISYIMARIKDGKIIPVEKK